MICGDVGGVLAQRVGHPGERVGALARAQTRPGTVVESGARRSDGPVHVGLGDERDLADRRLGGR
ncbi:hypothetical protein CcI49_17875 [Frankia sp. CcI49]|nr:hypothetical protein CcI49_17875 [Frankia sp. CcI49]